MCFRQTVIFFYPRQEFAVGYCYHIPGFVVKYGQAPVMDGWDSLRSLLHKQTGMGRTKQGGDMH